jgi:plastocyanin
MSVRNWTALAILSVAATMGPGPRSARATPRPSPEGGDGPTSAAASCPRPGGSPVTVPVVLTLVKKDVMTADPHAPVVCPGDTITWTVAHKCADCAKQVKVKIGNRRLFFAPASDTTDFLNKGLFTACHPSATVTYGASPVPLSGGCNVKKRTQVESGCYKYGIIGTYHFDPEAEVQGGSGEPPSPCPSPSPAPSPGH